MEPAITTKRKWIAAILTTVVAAAGVAIYFANAGSAPRRGQPVSVELPDEFRGKHYGINTIPLSKFEDGRIEFPRVLISHPRYGYFGVYNETRLQGKEVVIYSPFSLSTERSISAHIVLIKCEQLWNGWKVWEFSSSAVAIGPENAPLKFPDWRTLPSLNDFADREAIVALLNDFQNAPRDEDGSQFRTDVLTTP